MKINPQDKLHTNVFVNNILLIICIFACICFITVFRFEIVPDNNIYKFSNFEENTLIGPIEVTGKSHIYKIIINHPSINNFASYISGEVLDENQDTLYEFGKDLWHESGYDSEGYWQESDKTMEAFLTFSEKGNYYIQLQTDNNQLQNMKIKLVKHAGSYIPFLMAGILSLIGTIFFFWMFNLKFISGICAKIWEDLEEDD